MCEGGCGRAVIVRAGYVDALSSLGWGCCSRVVVAARKGSGPRGRHPERGDV